MALRSVWNRVVNIVYDSIGLVFRSQEEIDVEIEDILADYGTYHADDTSLPAEATIRGNGIFASIADLTIYLDGGPPSNYVHILELPDYMDDDKYYQIYVEGGDF